MSLIAFAVNEALDLCSESYVFPFNTSASVQPNMPPPKVLGDIDALLNQLNLEEKIALLAGQGSFVTTGLTRWGIPSLTVSQYPYIGGELFGNASKFGIRLRMGPMVFAVPDPLSP